MSDIFIDTVGKMSSDWKLDEFVKYYAEHKQELDKIHSHTINSHVRVYDDNGNRYKVIRREGKTRLVRTCDAMETYKRDIIQRITEIEASLKILNDAIETLQQLLPKEEATDESVVKGMLAVAEHPEPLERKKI